MSNFAVSDFVNWSARLLAAQTVTILLLLLNVSHMGFPYAGDMKPAFLLMAVFYWSIYRPTLLPLPYTFCVGILFDVLSGMPMGLSAFLLLCVHMAVQRSRLFMMGQSFFIVWMTFGLTALLYILTLWAFVSLSDGAVLSMEAMRKALISVVLTMLFYPLVAMVLHALHRILPSAYDPMRGRR